MQESQVRLLFSIVFFNISRWSVPPVADSLLLFFLFRPGRYDSAERHCKNCPGFHEINSKSDVFPVEITKREHVAIVAYRTTENRSKEITSLVAVPLWRLMKMLIKAGMPLEPVETDVPDAMNITAAEPLERPPPVQAEKSAAGYSQNGMIYF
jgi:hypothetical protein